MNRVCVLILPSAADLDVAIGLEVFRVANGLMARSEFDVTVATIDDHPVTLTNGRTIAPTVSVADCGRVELGLILAHVHPGAEMLARSNKVIRRLARTSALQAGADYGPLLMASAGLLDGCRAACHKDLMEAARETYSLVTFVDELFVRCGERLTCAGHLSTADMLIDYLSTTAGDEFAGAVADEMIAAGPRSGSTSQRSVRNEARQGADERIQAAIGVMREYIECPLQISEISERVGLSRRMLEKLWKAKFGCSPQRYYAKERIDRGCSLLLFSTMSVSQIACACGYSSAAVFSRAFSEYTGNSPRQYRQMHGNKIAPAISLANS